MFLLLPYRATNLTEEAEQIFFLYCIKFISSRPDESSFLCTRNYNCLAGEKRLLEGQGHFLRH